MSFCTMHQAVTSNAVALCGLYQGPLDTYLRENPHLKRIVLCLDADGPGQEATEKFQAEYAEKGFTVSNRTPAQPLRDAASMCHVRRKERTACRGSRRH